MKKIILFILILGGLVFTSSLAQAEILSPTETSTTVTPSATPQAVTTEKATEATATTNNAEVTPPTVNDAYRNAKDAYQEKMTEYKTKAKDWLTAKDLYLRSKTNTNLENVLEKAKEHVLKVDELVIKYLLTIKTKVENMERLDESVRQDIIAEIDSKIEWLEEKQTEINNAVSKDDLVALSATIKDYWKDVRVKVKKFVGYILVGRSDLAVAKLEEAKEKVQTKIDLIKENGQNATKLEELLADFSNNIDLAKTQLENAKERFSQISTLEEANSLFRQGRDFISNANKYLREAWRDLQSIISELRNTRLDSKEISGTGTIHIEGQGTATLSGSGKTEGTTDTGATALVTDKGGDATIDLHGQGKKEELGNNQTRYTGFGNITVSGSDIEVTITGSNLNIDASGTGTITMKGTGTYRVGDGETEDIPAGGINVKLIPA